MLLSSIEGAAITWLKIDGVLHEYSTIPHMKEEVMEFLLNVKGIRIRAVTGRPGKMRLEMKGEGRVCAGDIATSGDFEIVNPELHLATLDSEDSVLSVEFNVDHGKGYQPVPQGDGTGGPVLGVLPIDAIYNPVRKVNYSVERTRVGQVTDYERLVLEVWTDGTITPAEASRHSSQALVSHLFRFTTLGHEAAGGPDRPSIAVSPEIYQTPIEKLGLSPRTLNCLKRAHVTKVGHALEMSDAELLKIRNFGEKSLRELMDKLHGEGILNDEQLAARGGDSVDRKQGHEGEAEVVEAAGAKDAAEGEVMELAQPAAVAAEGAADDEEPPAQGEITQEAIRVAREALARRVRDKDEAPLPSFEEEAAAIFPEAEDEGQEKPAEEEEEW
jgi:DNA-directed RNA polymerase subunit alpha